jgi:hypothetical protein
MSRRALLGTGILIGGGLVLALVLWWRQGPSSTQVRRTVITTVQEEAPASFLVTGTLDLHATVRIDSAEYVTPDWLTTLLAHGQPTMLSLLQGSARAEVEVPGRVSYGFDVRELRPEMITVRESGIIGVTLPPLAIHSIEPRLSRLRVRTATDGWMRVFSSDVPAAVRSRALSGVQAAFRTQAERRLQSATQPRVNTARALEKMLTPPLTAAGIETPRFRIEIGERLVLPPEGNGVETFRKD